MGETGSYRSILGNCEDLCFLLKPTEGARIEDTRAVTQSLLVNLAILDRRFAFVSDRRDEACVPCYGIKGFTRGPIVVRVSHAIILLDVSVLSKDSLAPYRLVF